MSLTLRPSAFPLWPDCQRRQFARMAPITIKDAGYTLRYLAPSVGASIGTATHAAVALAMNEKMTSGALPPDSVAEECGVEELKKRIQAEGVQWDGTTPNINTGQKQVRRQYRIYRLTLAEQLKPVAVEHRITIPTRKGNTLSGQIDLTDEGIRDLKTGTISRSNMAQYGGYSMLRRSEGGKVAHIVEDFVQRVPIDDAQPAPLEIRYDVSLAERVAAQIVTDIEEKYQRFLDTGDNMTFMANPNSVLCSEKFCSAWGTTWCEEWKR